jgi:hypothetical protein
MQIFDRSDLRECVEQRGSTSLTQITCRAQIVADLQNWPEGTHLELHTWQQVPVWHATIQVHEHCERSRFFLFHHDWLVWLIWLAGTARYAVCWRYLCRSNLAWRRAWEDGHWWADGLRFRNSNMASSGDLSAPSCCPVLLYSHIYISLSHTHSHLSFSLNINCVSISLHHSSIVFAWCCFLAVAGFHAHIYCVLPFFHLFQYLLFIAYANQIVSTAPSRCTVRFDDRAEEIDPLNTGMTDAGLWGPTLAVCECKFFGWRIHFVGGQVMNFSTYTFF